MGTPEYSLVIPIYNEEECLPELVGRLTALMERLDGPTEVILVDDGSKDKSYGLISDICSRDPRFHAVQLSRNFGHQTAITAGLDFASGNAVVVMDADLQDPPEVVLEMAGRWREGCEVVHAVRIKREGESAFKTASASWFYRVLARLGDVDTPGNAGDFRLVDRKALDAFRMMRETNRYVRGMFGWVGFRQCTVEYARPARFAGETKYPLRKMMKFAFDGIISFSNEPLRIALRIGFVLSFLSLTAAVVTLLLKFSGALEVPGWTSMIFAITFLGGVQLLTIGLMGEYISRIHDEVRGRPLYLVRETQGYERDPARPARPREAQLALEDASPAEDAPTVPPR
ncbi:MAG TPA: glycosyltransferase family 2 protein [Actinomycetota bacterium]|nr:glycosyltransferase family 2 protein [Actinomycetota bacterium]